MHLVHTITLSANRGCGADTLLTVSQLLAPEITPTTAWIEVQKSLLALYLVPTALGT